jgi:hypothetical protein
MKMVPVILIRKPGSQEFKMLLYALCAMLYAPCNFLMEEREGKAYSGLPSRDIMALLRAA